MSMILDLALLHEAEAITTGGNVHDVRAMIHRYKSAENEESRSKFELALRRMLLRIRNRKHCKHPNMKPAKLEHRGRVYVWDYCEDCTFTKEKLP